MKRVLYFFLSIVEKVPDHMITPLFWVYFCLALGWPYYLLFPPLGTAFLFCAAAIALMWAYRAIRDYRESKKESQYLRGWRFR